MRVAACMRLYFSLLLIAPALLLMGCRGQTAADLETDAPCSRVPIQYVSDGLNVTGLMSKPQGAGPFPLVLVNHGGFDPARKMAGFLDLFAAAGFCALAPDYRGCGGSEGRHELACGEVNDVLNAVRHAQKLRSVGSGQVCLFGFSHGAVVSLLAAAKEPGMIRGVIAVQGPVELAECYRHWVANREEPGLRALAGVHTIVGGTPEELPAAWKERSALHAAARIHCPVLLIYSDADAAVPSDQGPRMEQALMAAGNTHVRLLMLHGLNHGLTPNAWAGLKDTLLDFAGQHTRPQ